MTLDGTTFRVSKTWIAALLLGLGALFWVVLFALHLRKDRERCGEGFIQGDTRCCAPGQTELDGRCEGVPSSCPEPLELTSRGCVAPARIVEVHGGNLALGPTDWDAPRGERSTFEVGTFRIDAFEVTHHRYETCVRARACKNLEGAEEPGLPVTSVTKEQAEAFCRFAGGRLPSELEWIHAASLGGRYRYPWGPHGLVCRRAVFGMVEGPCATGRSGPELCGARPLGKSPLEIYDLAGNVAEWAKRGDGTAISLGGSFRSQAAASLKSWHASKVASDASSEIGFRCAYEGP
jgi:formylglycine-generating enzyme required for sulfatase activity